MEKVEYHQERNDHGSEVEEKSHVPEGDALLSHADKHNILALSLNSKHSTILTVRETKVTRLSSRQVYITAGSSLAYLIIGLVRAYSASAIPSIEESDPYLIPSREAKSWIGAIPPSGAFIGSLVAGKLMQYFGRRKTLQIAAPMFLLVWTWIALSPSLIHLLISRWLSGFTVGVVLPTVQVYVGECSSPENRGKLSSIPAMVMSLGILISYILGTWFAWRILAWFAVVVSAGMFIVLFSLPESPVWLRGKGKKSQMFDALLWLDLPPDHENIGKENKSSISDYVTSVSVNMNNTHASKKSEQENLFSRKVFFSPSVMKPLGIGMMLLVFQQVSGIDAIIFFTVEIFKSSGSSLNDHLATIIIGLVQLISNCVSTVLIDRSGRRPLLIISGLIMTIANAEMGFAFFVDLKQNVVLGYLPLVSLITFMIGFSLGFGGIPYVLLGELFPSRHRSALSAFAASLNLLTMFSVIKTYHMFEVLLTPAGTFWLYATFCAASVVFVVLCVPETKGKTLQEIEKHFRLSPVREKQEQFKSVASALIPEDAYKART